MRRVQEDIRLKHSDSDCRRTAAVHDQYSKNDELRVEVGPARWKPDSRLAPEAQRTHVAVLAENN